MAEKKMVCTICGWEYDPSAGVPGQGIKPGTPFSELPDNFRCPKCGAMKKWFK